MVFDWFKEETFADIMQEENNRAQDEDNKAYAAAKCKEPHEDGTECRPRKKDGLRDVCLDRKEAP